MASASAFAFLFLFHLLLSIFPKHSLTLDIGIGIGIGGGGSPSSPGSSNCSTPPPPPPPPPPKPAVPIKISPSPPPPQKSPKVVSPSPPPPQKPPKVVSPSPSPPKKRPPVRTPSPKPPPLEFRSERIKMAYYVIKKYKSRIESDPLKVKKTWRGPDVCSYKGFKCDSFPDDKVDAVAGVSFNNFNFSGKDLSLFGLVDKLKDITFFHANSNFFIGGIPEMISRVRYFYELDLSNNKYGGPFPEQVFNSVNLTFLDLRFNNFYGPVPYQLFDMDIISAIFLNNNKFNQKIPANLGNTPARYLTFTSNEFTGEIPRSIGIGKTKKNLIEVLFSGNKLCGCLPMEAGLLENAILLDASSNSITGPIPHSFACLAKMELLNFADNRLYGAVPEALCRLPHLGNLTLRNNFFTQVGPVCRNLMWKKILDVSGNCILGLPEQRSPAECSRFFTKVELCPNEKTMRYIPCKGNPYLNGPPAPHRPPPPRKMTEMRTYAALVPH